MVTTPEAQAHALKIADQMRKDLYAISAKGTTFVPEAAALVEQAYDYKFELID